VNDDGVIWRRQHPVTWGSHRTTTDPTKREENFNERLRLARRLIAEAAEDRAVAERLANFVAGRASKRSLWKLRTGGE